DPEQSTEVASEKPLDLPAVKEQPKEEPKKVEPVKKKARFHKLTIITPGSTTKTRFNLNLKNDADDEDDDDAPAATPAAPAKKPEEKPAAQKDKPKPAPAKPAPAGPKSPFGGKSTRTPRIG